MNEAILGKMVDGELMIFAAQYQSVSQELECAQNDIELRDREIAALKSELKRIVKHYEEYADPVLDDAIDMLRGES